MFPDRMVFMPDQVTIDILAASESGEDLLAETKFIMVAR